MVIDADEATQDPSAALSSGTVDHLAAMRHSAAHMMAAAVLDIFPDAKLAIGPAIKDGFYYDFDLPRPSWSSFPRRSWGSVRPSRTASTTTSISRAP